MEDWTGRHLSSAEKMKSRFSILCIMLCISLLQAVPVRELVMVDLPVYDVMSIYRELSGRAVETKYKLPDYRFTIQLLPNTDSVEASSIIEEMLMIDGVVIEEGDDGVFYAKKTHPRFVEESTPLDLEKRISKEHLNDFEALGIIDSIELKEMNPTCAIELIQTLTNKVTITSMFILGRSMSFTASKISAIECIRKIDAELVAQSIYMFSGENDTLVFIRKLN